MKILREGLQNFSTPERGALKKNCWARRGGSENLYTSKPTGEGEGLLKNGTASQGGLLKFKALSFNIFIPLVILNELSLNCKGTKK